MTRFVERLPEPLLQAGPAGVLWWQWLLAPVVLLAVWSLGYFLSRLTRAILARVARRTGAKWGDELVVQMGGPLTLAWTWALLYAVLPAFALRAAVAAWVLRGLRIGFFLVFFWVLWRTVAVVTQALLTTRWARAYPASRALIPLGGRIVGVAVLAMAVVAVLAELGYPVASLIAGLGIGGLALALAAQKTVENLFGAFSIGIDQPFREGDFVKIEDFVGTVEAIGLRSTRVRTLDRTLVTIPNGKLAEMRVETFAARDRIRLACELGLEYGMSVAQVRQVLAEMEKLLRAHPKIWPDAVVVRFKAFGESSLIIEVMAWFMTSDWGEFQVIRQEVLLGFMEIVQAAGAAFAFPTRTVYLAGAVAGPAGVLMEGSDTHRVRPSHD